MLVLMRSGRMFSARTFGTFAGGMSITSMECWAGTRMLRDGDAAKSSASIPKWMANTMKKTVSRELAQAFASSMALWTRDSG